MKKLEEKVKELRLKMSDRLYANIRKVGKKTPRELFYDKWHDGGFHDLDYLKEKSETKFDEIYSNYREMMKVSDNEIRKVVYPFNHYDIEASINSYKITDEHYKMINDPVYTKLRKLYELAGTTIFGKIFNLSNQSFFGNLLNWNSHNTNFAKTRIVTESVQNKIKNRTLKKEEYCYYLNASLEEIESDIRKNKFDLTKEEIKKAKRIHFGSSRNMTASEFHSYFKDY